MVKKERELWTIEELIEQVPKGLLKDYINPLKTPGRFIANVEGWK